MLASSTKGRADQGDCANRATLTAVATSSRDESGTAAVGCNVKGASAVDVSGSFSPRATEWDRATRRARRASLSSSRRGGRPCDVVRGACSPFELRSIAVVAVGVIELAPEPSWNNESKSVALYHWTRYEENDFSECIRARRRKKPPHSTNDSK